MECFSDNKRKNLAVSAPDYKALLKLTVFNKTELKQIFGRYETVADEVEGTVTKSAFLAIPELLCCPVASMIFDREISLLDKASMSFLDFVLIIDVLSRNTSVEDKMKCKLPNSTLPACKLC